MSATIMTVDKVRSLMTTAMGDVFSNRGKEVPSQYKEWLREFKTKHAVLVDMDITYFGEVPRRNSELEPIFYDEIQFGAPRITEANQFAFGFKVSKSALQKLAKAPFGEFSSAKIASMKTLMEKMKDSVRHTKELVAVDLLRNITSTSTTARGYVGLGRDGAALAGTHYTKMNPRTAWLNTFTNESLSLAALEKHIRAQMTIPSDEGMPRAIGSKFKLLLGPKLIFRAKEILRTPFGVDSEYRNENIIKSDYNIEPVSLIHLGADYNGYTMVDPSQHGLGFFAPVEDEFDDAYDFDTRGQKYSIYFEFIVDARHPFGVTHTEASA
jgi:hypothetical protein